MQQFCFSFFLHVPICATTKKKKKILSGTKKQNMFVSNKKLKTDVLQKNPLVLTVSVISIDKEALSADSKSDDDVDDSIGKEESAVNSNSDDEDSSDKDELVNPHIGIENQVWLLPAEKPALIPLRAEADCIESFKVCTINDTINLIYGKDWAFQTDSLCTTMTKDKTKWKLEDGLRVRQFDLHEIEYLKGQHDAIEHILLFYCDGRCLQTPPSHFVCNAKHMNIIHHI